MDLFITLEIKWELLKEIWFTYTILYFNYLIIFNYTYQNYFSDNVPTVLLAEWNIEANMWDGEILAGPVPTFYAENAAEARAAFMADQIKGHADILKMERIFFMPEVIGLEEALALVKKPRYSCFTLLKY